MNPLDNQMGVSETFPRSFVTSSIFRESASHGRDAQAAYKTNPTWEGNTWGRFSSGYEHPGLQADPGIFTGLVTRSPRKAQS
jgi:hypothetical protein